MTWDEVRAAYPEQMLIIEVLKQHQVGERIYFDDMLVVESVSTQKELFRRLRHYKNEFREDFFCFACTHWPQLEVFEGPPRFSPHRYAPGDDEGRVAVNDAHPDPWVEKHRHRPCRDRHWRRTDNP